MQWKGVMPAITTPFDDSLKIDLSFVARQARWLAANGSTGIVCLGSLGEAATLNFDEKLQLVRAVVASVSPAIPVVGAVSALSTADAVKLANALAEAGVEGLMILPPYIYQGDWREMKSHLTAILQATSLPAMLYNNPVAYGTDLTPAQIAELADEFANLEAVKESSTDVRRVTAIRALVGDRLSVSVGVDDAIVEGVDAGSIGWIAGLANALPRESVELFNLAQGGHRQSALNLYHWFLPLLRMDTVPKFVQLIKLVQERQGVGSVRVRAPRLPLEGKELEEAERVIDTAMGGRDQKIPVSTPFL